VSALPSAPNALVFDVFASRFCAIELLGRSSRILLQDLTSNHPVRRKSPTSAAANCLRWHESGCFDCSERPSNSEWSRVL